MKILVTGGGGFIGKHLVKYLLKKEHQITIFDNFSNSNRETTLELQEKGVKIIEGDIVKIDELSSAIQNHDIVIHLAAKISVEESIKDPSETFHVNVDGTKNVLIACEKNHVKKLIVASSAAVYGEGLQNSKLVESSKINPISPYGESKAIMEEEIRGKLSQKSTECIILRFFNIFGEGQTAEYAGVITKFIKKIMMNEPLIIFGDGMQTRDFVSVNDVVNAIYCAITNGKSGIYNIASGKSITINKLAEQMILWSEKNLKINHIAPKKGDILFSQADISLAKKEIKYEPKSELEEIKELLK